ncbi:MAG: hypothetical protein CM15mV86_130 [uncultured marine virus]|nr:MAG: hypothetical protein CM15mV86_130 [uncultured marine virus]
MHAGAFAINVANTNEAMRINSSGNVGIGTTSPARALEVNAGSIDIVALLTSTDANSTLAFWDGSGGAAITNASGELALRTNGSSSDGSATTERVRIDSSGNVGIGTLPVQKKPYLSWVIFRLRSIPL